MLHLHECADPGPAESGTKPLHSGDDSTTAEEYVVEPLHSTADPTAVEFTAEPLKSVADSDAVVDAPTKTSCS
jgi:hypothetical protein